MRQRPRMVRPTPPDRSGGAGCRLRRKNSHPHALPLVGMETSSVRLTRNRFVPVPVSPESISQVPRRVKDFIDISEYTSLDDLLRYLQAIRDNLPADHQAELRIRGDDVFGRRLTISYFREQTAEEVELESKYAGGDRESGNIEELRRKLDEVPFKLRKRN